MGENNVIKINLINQHFYNLCLRFLQQNGLWFYQSPCSSFSSYMMAWHGCIHTRMYHQLLIAQGSCAAFYVCRPDRKWNSRHVPANFTTMCVFVLRLGSLYAGVFLQCCHRRRRSRVVQCYCILCCYTNPRASCTTTYTTVYSIRIEFT